MIQSCNRSSIRSIKIILYNTLFLFLQRYLSGSCIAAFEYHYYPPSAEQLNLQRATLPDIPKGFELPIMRAWRCHGASNRELVEKLSLAQIVKTKAVQEALLKIDRGNYVLAKESAYVDAPQSLGLGQTISAPHMHAHVLEELLPTLVVQQRTKPMLKILDVGCGSGYLTSCLGRLVHEHQNSLGLKGRVYGIDILPKLVELSKYNAQKADSDLMESNIVSFQNANGWKGLSSEAPFDAIHVGAAAEDFPRDLMIQLAVGGRMVCPVGPDGGIQYLYRIDRVKQSDESNSSFQKNDFNVQELLGVRYVPLVQRAP